MSRQFVQCVWHLVPEDVFSEFGGFVTGSVCRRTTRDVGVVQRRVSPEIFSRNSIKVPDSLPKLFLFFFFFLNSFCLTNRKSVCGKIVKKKKKGEILCKKRVC